MSFVARFSKKSGKKAPRRVLTATTRRAIRRSTLTTRIRPELKYGDSTFGANVIPNGGYVACINQIAAGTDYANRIGRKVTCRYVQVDWNIAPGTFADFGFVALVLDHASDNALANLSDIFAAFGGYYAQPFRNLAVNSARFKVLKMSLWPNIASSVLPCRERWMVRVPQSLAEARYAAAGGGIPQTGAMLIVAASNLNSNITSATIQVTSRYAYTDV